MADFSQPTMGFFDLAMPHTYENCLSQYNWCIKLVKDAKQLKHDPDTVNMLQGMADAWKEKANRLKG